MRISGIYKIQSKCKPERIYVGSSKNVKERWNEHSRFLRNNNHHSHKLQRHFNKYGANDLMFIIIEPCLTEFLIIREQFYMDRLNPYFNECLIAGSTLGFKHSPLTIEEMKKNRKGKLSWRRGKHGIYSEDTLKKMSQSHMGNKSNRGRKLTEEHKNNISKGQMGNQRAKGYKQTEEHKRKAARFRTGRKASEETRIKMKRAWEIRKQNKAA